MAALNITGDVSSLGTNLTQLLTADDIEPGTDPSYQLCKTIYLYHPLGQKMAESPIGMAQFKPREVTIPKSPEERVKKAFEDEWKAVGADGHIFNVAALARVYGVASIACITKGVPVDRPLDFRGLAKATLAFSVFDPLNTAGSLVLSQNPNDLDFMKSTNISVQASQYHRSRTVVIMNEKPIYLGYTVSAFGYVGRSVYQRALFPLKSFIQTMRTDDLISSKAGVIVAKIKQAGSIVDNMMQKLFGLKREFVKAAQTYGVISIGPDDAIESLNLQNIDGAGKFARTNILENIAVAADMPAKLLNAETFAEGFGEGTEDAKHVARYVDRVRTWMGPLYDFFDQIVMYRAWNEEFYATIQKEFPEEYGDKAFNVAFFEWKNSFAAKWPDLLTEPESERSKAEDVKFKAIIAMVEVLMPDMDPGNRAKLIAWAADNFNALDTMFSTPLVLDYEELAAYEPKGELQEPNEPKPFAATDAQIAAVFSTLLSRMPKRQIREARRQLTHSASVQ